MLRASKAPRVSTLTRAFSASTRSLKEKERKRPELSNATISKKLSEELKLATERKAREKKPDILSTFQAHGIWKIEESPGNGEVALTREFGKETIRVQFSLEEFQSWDHDDLAALGMDVEAESDPGAEGEWAMPNGDTMRARVYITKPTGPGALEFDINVESGGFLIDRVTYYPDSSLSREDFDRYGLYRGPEFSSLSLSVQEQFEEFLQKRGLGEGAALFLPKYAAYKKQMEYSRWLQNVKGFIDE